MLKIYESLQFYFDRKNTEQTNRKEKREIETGTHQSNHIDIIWMYFDAFLCFVIMPFPNFQSKISVPVFGDKGCPLRNTQ
jgi:hypothetical protein